MIYYYLVLGIILFLINFYTGMGAEQHNAQNTKKYFFSHQNIFIVYIGLSDSFLNPNSTASSRNLTGYKTVLWRVAWKNSEWYLKMCGWINKVVNEALKYSEILSHSILINFRMVFE